MLHCYLHLAYSVSSIIPTASLAEMAEITLHWACNVALVLTLASKMPVTHLNWPILPPSAWQCTITVMLSVIVSSPCDIIWSAFYKAPSKINTVPWAFCFVLEVSPSRNSGSTFFFTDTLLTSFRNQFKLILCLGNCKSIMMCCLISKSRGPRPLALHLRVCNLMMQSIYIPVLLHSSGNDQKPYSSHVNGY